MPNYQSPHLFQRPLVAKCHLIVMMLISTCGLLMACGPGRFGGSRKPNTTPMGLKQSLPDVEETSIDASGSYRGPMKRGSEEFKALVRNFNTDIVFKDDEKNEDDRRMTKVIILCGYYRTEYVMTS